MVEYKTCQISDIIADAKKFGRVEELKSYGLGKVNAKKIDEEGNKVSYKRNRTFLEIRKWYYETYYSELLPTKKPAKKTMYNLLEEL